jgi:hypothetical protein
MKFSGANLGKRAPCGANNGLESAGQHLLGGWRDAREKVMSFGVKRASDDKAPFGGTMRCYFVRKIAMNLAGLRLPLAKARTGAMTYIRRMRRLAASAHRRFLQPAALNLGAIRLSLHPGAVC